MDLVRKWMSGAVMTNNSMEDVASKFGNNWGRLAAVIVIWRNPVKFHRSHIHLRNLPQWEKKPTISPLKINFLHQNSSFLTYTL